MKTLTIDACKQIQKFNDFLRNQIASIEEGPKERLEQAKAEWHQATIEANKLRKELILNESSLSIELQAQLAEQNRLYEEYRFKTNSDMKDYYGIKDVK